MEKKERNPTFKKCNYGHAISRVFQSLPSAICSLVLFYQNVLNFSCWTNDDQQPSIQSDRHSWQCVIHGWGGNNPIRNVLTIFIVWHLSVLGELIKYTSYKYFVYICLYDYRITFPCKFVTNKKSLCHSRWARFYLSVKIHWF